MAETGSGAAAKTIAPDTRSQSETRSGHRIADVETYRLKLPYRNAVAFKSVKESTGEYVILRLVLDDGTEGISESVCRTSQSGEDATALAYVIDTYFKPMLIGADPLQYLAILQKLNAVKFCRSAKAMIDIALWDMRGKILGQPVWRLLGGADPEPIPLTWIAHGNTREAQVEEARRKVEERGFKGMKLKTWRRSLEDVRMVGEVRKAIGDSVMIYVDGNGSYSEGEARTILSKVQDFNVSFIEEPCNFADPSRQAILANQLPVALLGDQCAQSIDAVQTLLRLHAVGAISVKLRRTGFTQSLKIITLCEAAGVPAVIGTDSESRIGALVRMHLRAAIPSLAPWPTETHFFEKLSDDAFAGDFRFADGQITIDDTPGFGASIDRKKLEQYAF
jgi:L-alanine-DL-glutamate epimerase-like enolase superfamily enzyme